MIKSHYARLAAMSAQSFLAMYVLMYAMVDALRNVYPNFNQFYMAGLMTAAMVLIEIAVMGGMYGNKKLNAAIVAGALAALLAFFALIRQQAVISDREFLKSMIPHHASAILMCERAPLREADVRALCESIVSGQQAEIDQMKAKLRELRG